MYFSLIIFKSVFSLYVFVKKSHMHILNEDFMQTGTLLPDNEGAVDNFPHRYRLIFHFAKKSITEQQP